MVCNLWRWYVLNRLNVAFNQFSGRERKKKFDLKIVQKGGIEKREKQPQTFLRKSYDPS
jgi:hypothetical protein